MKRKLIKRIGRTVLVFMIPMSIAPFAQGTFQMVYASENVAEIGDVVKYTEITPFASDFITVPGSYYTGYYDVDFNIERLFVEFNGDGRWIEVSQNIYGSFTNNAVMINLSYHFQGSQPTVKLRAMYRQKVVKMEGKPTFELEGYKIKASLNGHVEYFNPSATIPTAVLNAMEIVEIPNYMAFERENEFGAKETFYLALRPTSTSKFTVDGLSPTNFEKIFEASQNRRKDAYNRLIGYYTRQADMKNIKFVDLTDKNIENYDEWRNILKESIETFNSVFGEDGIEAHIEEVAEGESSNFIVYGNVPHDYAGLAMVSSTPRNRFSLYVSGDKRVLAGFNRIKSTTVHEMGHLLGFTDDAYALSDSMYSYGRDAHKVTYHQPNDIATLRSWMGLDKTDLPTEKGSVLVKYVDQSGNTIKEEIDTGESLIQTYYDTSEFRLDRLNVNGKEYTFVKVKDGDVESGGVTAGQKVVTYIYKDPSFVEPVEEPVVNEPTPDPPVEEVVEPEEEKEETPTPVTPPSEPVEESAPSEPKAETSVEEVVEPTEEDKEESPSSEAQPPSEPTEESVLNESKPESSIEEVAEPEEEKEETPTPVTPPSAPAPEPTEESVPNEPKPEPPVEEIVEPEEEKTETPTPVISPVEPVEELVPNEPNPEYPVEEVVELEEEKEEISDPVTPPSEPVEKPVVNEPKLESPVEEVVEPEEDKEGSPSPEAQPPSEPIEESVPNEPKPEPPIEEIVELEEKEEMPAPVTPPEEPVEKPVVNEPKAESPVEEVAVPVEEDKEESPSPEAQPPTEPIEESVLNEPNPEFPIEEVVEPEEEKEETPAPVISPVESVEEPVVNEPKLESPVEEVVEPEEKEETPAPVTPPSAPEPTEESVPNEPNSESPIEEVVKPEEEKAETPAPVTPPEESVETSVVNEPKSEPSIEEVVPTVPVSEEPVEEEVPNLLPSDEGKEEIPVIPPTNPTLEETVEKEASVPLPSEEDKEEPITPVTPPVAPMEEPTPIEPNPEVPVEEVVKSEEEVSTPLPSEEDKEETPTRVIPPTEPVEEIVLPSGPTSEEPVEEEVPSPLPSEEDKEKTPSPVSPPVEPAGEIVEPEKEVLLPLEVDSSSSDSETVVSEETLSPKDEKLTTSDTEKNDLVEKNSAPSNSENDNELATAATNTTVTETTKPIATSISPAVSNPTEKVTTLPKTGTYGEQRNLPNILGAVSLLFGGLFLKLTSKKRKRN